MKSAILAHLKKVEDFSTSKPKEIEAFRIEFLGKKGVLNELFKSFKESDSTQKKELGILLNQLKNNIEIKVKSLKKQLDRTQDHKIDDLTKPGKPFALGSRHPISIVRDKIIEIFASIGYIVAEGPEVEDDWHNFTALNLPEHHPARDMQDTFFIDSQKILLRTHTSSVQIRHMEQNKPPIRILSPGRVYRNEAISYRAHCMFHQIEGLYIDKDVSFADLKQSLQYFTQELFGRSQIRLRPSYFPFTEPSAEVDVYWGLETETDYKITKGTGWLEIMGCGMVDPKVLENVGIDPEIYSGFAFGMGIERIAMLLYQIDDLRLYFENDLRFLNQFKTI